MLFKVWGGTHVGENDLHEQISVLRATLGEKPGDNEYIETVPRRGYRFIAKVTTVKKASEVPSALKPSWDNYYNVPALKAFCGCLIGKGREALHDQTTSGILNDEQLEDCRKLISSVLKVVERGEVIVQQYNAGLLTYDGFWAVVVQIGCEAYAGIIKWMGQEYADGRNVENSGDSR